VQSFYIIISKLNYQTSIVVGAIALQFFSPKLLTEFPKMCQRCFRYSYFKRVLGFFAKCYSL